MARRRIASDGRVYARDRLYDKAWEKAARALLIKRPVCANFGKDPKCTGRAEHVDHIKPHGGDRRLFWDKRNWQGLCRGCHNRKTVRERKQRPSEPRHDQSGMPTDPSHHWNTEGET